MGILADAYVLDGRPSEARQILEELIALRATRHLDATTIATIYVALGEDDQALSWLEKAYEERSFWLTWLNVIPNWDRIRADPRFIDLARRVGVPKS